MSEINSGIDAVALLQEQIDAEIRSRNGHSVNQNPLKATIGRGSEVAASSQPIETRFGSPDKSLNGVAERPQSCTSAGKSVSGREVEVAKPVDHVAFQGRYAGTDTRRKASPAVLPSQPGPRDPHNQARLTSKLD